MRGERAAYRALSRLCRAADRDPAQLVALLGRPTVLYHADEQRFVRAPPSSHPFVDDAIAAVSGGSTEYAHPVGAAARAARDYYRRASLMGGPDVVDMRRFGQRLLASRMVATKLRAFPSALGPLRSSSQRVRPQVSTREPSTLSRLPPDCGLPLQAGMFLLTHPLSGLFQEVYDQAVILILRTSRETDTAQGLILNKPRQTTFRELVASVPQTDASDTVLGPDWQGTSWKDLAVDKLMPFLDDPVFMGGPIIHESLDDSVLWLHTHGDIVPSSIELAPDLYLGGDISIAAATEQSRHERGSAAGLRLFRGFSAWSLSQLETELQRGVWVRALASCPSATFELCFGQSTLDRWRFAMEAVGLPALARFPRGLDVDDFLREVVEHHQRAMAIELMDYGRT